MERSGLVPLLNYACCSYGNGEIVEYLLKSGASTIDTDSHGATPLHAVVHGLNPKMFNDDLIRRTADEDEQQAILMAKNLIAHGVNIEHLDKDGKTACDYALEKNLLFLEQAIRLRAKKAANEGEKIILKELCCPLPVCVYYVVGMFISRRQKQELKE